MLFAEATDSVFERVYSSVLERWRIWVKRGRWRVAPTSPQRGDRRIEIDLVGDPVLFAVRRLGWGGKVRFVHQTRKDIELVGARDVAAGSNEVLQGHRLSITGRLRRKLGSRWGSRRGGGDRRGGRDTGLFLPLSACSRDHEAAGCNKTHAPVPGHAGILRTWRQPTSGQQERLLPRAGASPETGSANELYGLPCPSVPRPLSLGGLLISVGLWTRNHRREEEARTHLATTTSVKGAAQRMAAPASQRRLRSLRSSPTPGSRVAATPVAGLDRCGV